MRSGEGRAPARPPSRTAQATGEGLSISPPLHGSNEDGAISARRSCGREALPLTRARCCNASLPMAATSKAPGANLSRLVSLVSCPPVMSEGVRQETRDKKPPAHPSARTRDFATHRFPEGRGYKRRQASITCGAVPRPIDLILLPMPIGSVSRCVSGRDVLPHVRRAGRRKPQGKDSPSPHLCTAQMKTAQSRRGGHGGAYPSSTHGKSSPRRQRKSISRHSLTTASCFATGMNVSHKGSATNHFLPCFSTPIQCPYSPSSSRL